MSCVLLWFVYGIFVYENMSEPHEVSAMIYPVEPHEVSAMIYPVEPHEVSAMIDPVEPHEVSAMIYPVASRCHLPSIPVILVNTQ